MAGDARDRLIIELRRVVAKQEDELARFAELADRADQRAAAAEARLAQCDASVASLTSRFVDLHTRALAQETELHEVHQEAIAAHDEIDVLRREAARRDETDDRLLTHNRGGFAVLGLRVAPLTGAPNRDGQCPAVVTEVRPPASQAGVRVGDVLQRVRATADWRIDSVLAYKACIADVPIDADVELVLLRDGQQTRLTLKPAVMHDDSPVLHGSTVESRTTRSASQYS